MLLDRPRSLLVGPTADPNDFHGRDIYLTYRLECARMGIGGAFIVYDKENPLVTAEFEQAIDGSRGFLVQGSLPREWIEVLADRVVPLAPQQTP